MKIMELEKYDKFRVTEENAKVPVAAYENIDGTVYSMGRLDGMYCYCFDKDMARYYFAAWTEVEKVEG